MNATEALNKLCKWRLVLSGRVWGTAPKGPQAKGRADIFEKLLIMRAELNALTQILHGAGIINPELWDRVLADEAMLLDAAIELEFPGMRSTQQGMVLNPELAAETMKGWPA